MTRTYIDRARELLAGMLPGQDPALLDLYLLLALTRGQDVTLADVHDAWAIWRSRSRAGHPSIIPFDQLAAEVQALDEPYMDAIAAVARAREAADALAHALTGVLDDLNAARGGDHQ